MTDNDEQRSKDNDSESDLSDAFMARQIVQEILNFGISQGQMIKIIQVLSLELENRELMLEINDLIENITGEGDSSQNVEANALIKEI